MAPIATKSARPIDILKLASKNSTASNPPTPCYSNITWKSQTPPWLRTISISGIKDIASMGSWFEMSRSISAQVVQDFKSYKPGISRGTGKPKPQKKSQKKRRLGRKSSTPTITIILLLLLAILLTQWQKLPQLSKCAQALDFGLCVRVIGGR
jgi:hypothetical protein